MEEEKKENMWIKIKGVLSYVIIIVVVLLIKEFVITPIRVKGDSMVKTLHDKDIMLLDKISYRFNDIKRFDIVVVKLEDEYIIKRVIGLPGETVEYKDNKLYINGKQVKEDFKHEDTNDFILEEEIPEGFYFVMGDNRPISFDSRMIGLIKKNRILGKTSLVIFPLDRIGNKK